MKKILILVLAVGALLAGCGGGSTSDTRLGAIRFVAGVPDAPNLDVYVNGSKDVSTLAYMGFSYYLFYDEGSPHVQFRSQTSGVNIVDFNVPISALQYKTVVAYNFLSTTRASVLTDDRSLPPSGVARVRIVHLAPSGGNVDIYFNAPSVDISGISPTNSNVPFESNQGYVNIPAGSYRMIVTKAGTKTVLLDSGTLTLASQMGRTILLLDKKGGGTPLTALIQYDIN